MQRTIVVLCIILSILISPLSQPISGLELHDENIKNQQGSLSGYIKDQFGNPIKDAKVSVHFHGHVLKGTSDEDGYYYVDNIWMCYCLKDAFFTKPGYNTIKKTLSIRENTSCNVKLEALNIHYVGGNNPDNYMRIQDAIDNASSNEMVYVYDGIYDEQLSIFSPIILVGESKNATIIDGDEEGHCIFVGSSNVTIQNVNITNSGTNSRDAGIKIERDHAFISNCQIQRNFFGIYVEESKNCIIHNCRVQQNDEIGIFLEESSTILVTQCHIHGNKEGFTIQHPDPETNQSNIEIRYCRIDQNEGIGIAVRNKRLFSSGCSNIQIEHNEIVNNKDSGISVEINGIVNNTKIKSYTENHHLLISNCTIQKNSRGINIAFANNMTIQNCLIEHNHASSIHVMASSNITIQYCDIQGNGDYFNYSIGGIIIRNSPECTTQSTIIIKHCSILHNAYNGISIGNGGEEGLGYRNVSIHHNLIKDNTGGGIIIWTSEVNIHNNTFDTNGVGDPYDSGIMCSDVSGLVQIHQNIFYNNAVYGIYFIRSNDNIVRNNNFFENTIHIGFLYKNDYFSNNTYLDNYYDDVTIPWFKIHHGFYILRIGLSPHMIVLLIHKFVVEWYPLSEPYDIPEIVMR